MNDKNNELFNIISETQISTAVENAFSNLNETYFGHVPIKKMNLNTQVLCSVLHELIVHEIASLLDGKQESKNRKLT